MLHHTQAIVLKTLRYSETSVVAHIYTEKFGRLTYIINGVYTQKSKFKPALLQALSPLEIITYYRENKNLQRLSEIKPLLLWQQIPFIITKSSLSLFAAEVLYNVLHEAETNPPLFNFLLHALQCLDQCKDTVANWHILFLVQLSAYLGFFPQNNFFYTERAVFDLQEGNFIHKIPTHQNYIVLPDSYLLAKCLQTPIDQAASLSMSQQQRKTLLYTMIRYYELHIEGFSEPKSLKILEEVLA